MAAAQEAEIVFAQRLASNTNPVRSKAISKLRKYISCRSKVEGGFSEEELLKIWKGLFYCVWMQDKPLLQEELSRKISGLLYSFGRTSAQFLYFQTFLQTMKREWNGIDRLRMDKFFQLVRMLFRDAFKMLKRLEWESSQVEEFLQIISSQLLQSSSSPPAGLMLHILELYMTELALVGGAELTAEQNLAFTQPFFLAMAETKDRVLLKAIAENMLNVIVDQVPFVVQDLLREMKNSSDLQDDNEEPASDGLEEKDEEEADCGPVLQFDYSALADRLFQVASPLHILTFNRSKIYKFVKIFRDLSEGMFPQDEVESVSSEDDDYDDVRRRKKKKPKQDNRGAKKSTESSANTETQQDSKPVKKKKRRQKKKKNGAEELPPSEEHNQQQPDQTDPAELQNSSCMTQEQDENSETQKVPDMELNASPVASQKKQKRKRKKSGVSDAETVSVNTEESETSIITPLKKRKNSMTNGEAESVAHVEETPGVSIQPSLKKLKRKINATDVEAVAKVAEEASNGCTVTPPECSEEASAGAAPEETPEASTVTPSKKKQLKKKSVTEAESSEPAAPEETPEASTVTPSKKKQLKKKSVTEAESSEPVPVEELPDVSINTPSKKQLKKKSITEDECSETSAGVPLGDVSTITPLKKQLKKKKKKKKSMTDAECSEQASAEALVVEIPDVSIITPSKKKHLKKKKSMTEAESSEEVSAGAEEIPDVTTITPLKKKKKKKSSVTDAECSEELSAGAPLVEVPEVSTITPSRKMPLKKKSMTEAECSEEPSARTAVVEIPEVSTITPSRKKPLKKKSMTEAESSEEPSARTAVVEIPVVSTITPSKRKKLKKKSSLAEDECSEEVTSALEEMPDVSTITPLKKKAAASVKLNLRAAQQPQLKKSLNGQIDKVSDRVSSGFVLRQKKAPVPVFCKTPIRGKKGLLSVSSDQKKVTFGLEKNKTMEFRKMDRSSQLSPATQSRLPFDPNRTPRSGVLKSSPRLTRRATAADFF